MMADAADTRPRVVAIVQARMGSSRLPGKVMASIAGKPAIWHLFRQLGFARRVDEAILATTTGVIDDPLATYAKDQGWKVFRGSEANVLDRYYRAAMAAGMGPDDIIVRVTGDDILVDPEIVDQIVELLVTSAPPAKHASNNRSRGFPYGADVEAFTVETLGEAWRDASRPEEREHVTPYIRCHPDRFPFVELRSPVDYSHVRLSIDYPEDLEFNRRLIERLQRPGRRCIHLADILDCIEQHQLRHALA